MPLHIATWGDPLNWTRATYRSRTELAMREKEVNCWTTVPLYQGETVIVGLASVLFSSLPSDPNRLGAFCPAAKSSFTSRSSRALQDLEGESRAYLEELAEGCIKECVPQVRPDLKVVIIPVLGKFRDVLFDVQPEHVRGYMVRKLYPVVKSTKEDTVVLDVTHSLNFVTVMAHDVTNWLTSLTNKDLVVVYAVPTGQNSYELVEVGTPPRYKPLSEDLIELARSAEDVRAEVVEATLKGSLQAVQEACGRWGGFDDSLPKLELARQEGGTKVVALTGDTAKAEERRAKLDAFVDYLCSKVRGAGKEGLRVLAEELSHIAEWKT